MSKQTMMLFNSCESLNVKAVTESTHISNYEIYLILKKKI